MSGYLPFVVEPAGEEKGRREKGKGRGRERSWKRSNWWN